MKDGIGHGDTETLRKYPKSYFFVYFHSRPMLFLAPMETPYRFAPADSRLECPDELADKVIGAAIRVHRYFGPGQFERIYQEALAIELSEEGIPLQTEVKIEVAWRGRKLGVGFRADMVVSDCLVLELKCVQHIAPVHEAQLIGYLRLLRIKTGILMNFHSPLLKDGIRRRSI